MKKMLAIFLSLSSYSCFSAQILECDLFKGHSEEISYRRVSVNLEDKGFYQYETSEVLRASISAQESTHNQGVALLRISEETGFSEIMVPISNLLELTEGATIRFSHNKDQEKILSAVCTKGASTYNLL